MSLAKVDMLLHNAYRNNSTHLSCIFTDPETHTKSERGVRKHAQRAAAYKDATSTDAYGENDGDRAAGVRNNDRTTCYVLCGILLCKREETAHHHEDHRGDLYVQLHHEPFLLLLENPWYAA